MSPTLIVAYLVLFATVGFLFVFASLLLGRFLRARMPTAEKQETYECGEPAVGSSYVRFDLRFYVVALLFIIFDVEVAFFFPWATVFGKATQLMDPNLEPVIVVGPDSGGTEARVELSGPAATKHRELGIGSPELADSGSGVAQASQRIREGAGKLARAAIIDVGVFFAVLLVGFAYVWNRGDLDWVRPASWRRERSLQRTQGAGGAGSGAVR